MKILIVDDNEDVKLLNKLTFQQAGIDVVALTTGLEALQYLDDSNDVDAVILDLAMPVMDGLTVAQEIRFNEQKRAKEPPVHLAFYTARNIDPPIERVIAKTHVERVFRKPCSPHELVSEVQAWLN